MIETPTAAPEALVRYLLGTVLFDAEDEGGPALTATFAAGDPECKFLVIAGENASGKSLFRRLIGSVCHEAKPRMEHITTSLEGRLTVNEAPWLAMVYGSENWDATGRNSASIIMAGIRTAQGRDTPHVITWDEPELGLSEGAQVGAGQALAAFGRAMGQHTRVATVITHSRLLVRELAPLAPHFLYLGRTEPLSLADWLQAPVVARSLEDVMEDGVQRLRKVSKILKT